MNEMAIFDHCLFLAIGALIGFWLGYLTFRRKRDRLGRFTS